MITILAAAIAGSDVLPSGFSTPLLTWSGVIAVVLGLLLWGLLIPRATHLREIRSIKDANAALVASYQAQLADKNAEIAVLRSTVTVGQSSQVELLAQHRLVIEGMRAVNYSIEQMRNGMERVQKEATP